MSISSQTAIFGITLYQRFISPYKGYHCAHAALHQGKSCSQAVKFIIAEQGVLNSWTAIRQRFAACRAASLVLRQGCKSAEHPCNDAQKRKDKRCRDTCLDNCNLSCDCFDFKRSKSDCDLPCDCFDFDCNPFN